MAITITLGRSDLNDKPKFIPRLPVISSILPSICKREGWDDESNQYEKCGSNFKQAGCECHLMYCPDCSSEIHGISLSLPGVIEHSAIEHHCSIKGNW